MAIKVPAKTATRISSSLKKFQSIISSALARDVNESDTAMIVKDIVSQVLGYDKYHEITSEHQIRGTYCDIAVVVEGTLRLLIEVKAIGLDLKDSHVRQAVNYAANQGTEWVVLTNCIKWRIYKVDFGKQVTEELVTEIDMLTVDPKNNQDMESIFIMSREGLLKGAMTEYYSQKKAMNRHVLGAIILSDTVTGTIRRELKKLAPGINITQEQLRDTVKNEVLKREITEGEDAEEAVKKVQKMLGKIQKKKPIKVPPLASAYNEKLPADDIEENTPNNKNEDSPNPPAEN